MRVIARLPRGTAFAAASALGRRRFRRARGTVLATRGAELEALLGLSAAEVERVAARSFEHAACDELEYALLPRLATADLDGYLDVRGLEHLQAALDRGRGAIIYSGHVRGHYLLFATLRATILGMPHSEALSPGRRRTIERRDAALRRLGCSFLDMGGSDFAVAARAANILRRNGVVTSEIDHTHSEQNLDAAFLGRPARFPAGPFLLARATGAPLVHFWLHRPETHSPQVAELHPPIEVGDDLDAALRTALVPLEANVRRHPESWATWLFPEMRVWREAG